MPDGLGPLNPVLSPILERVVREERLGRDHPRRQQEKHERAREDDHHTGASPSESKEAEASMTSIHIDLRI